MPDIYIIAGPNGAGKTTAAYSLLPDVFQTVEFVNADEIARGLSPFNPEGVALQAARIMLDRIELLMKDGKSFAFETTLSGLTYIDLVRNAKQIGYNVTLFFVWLSSYELAFERVAIRVSKGGHNIPKDVIKRRYVKGMANVLKYTKEVDSWYVYDNSGPQYTLIAKSIERSEEIINFEVYQKITGHGK